MAVGVLVFCGNWAGPLLWTSAHPLLLKDERCAGQKCIFLQHLALLTMFAAVSVVSTMLACTALRTHLFIWTVFSPKYLYTMAWSIGQHLCVNIAYGGLLAWLGSV